MGNLGYLFGPRQFPFRQHLRRGCLEFIFKLPSAHLPTWVNVYHNSIGMQFFGVVQTGRCLLQHDEAEAQAAESWGLRLAFRLRINKRDTQENMSS